MHNQTKISFSIVVLAWLSLSFACHCLVAYHCDDTLLGGGVTYSRPISYASCFIRVALPLLYFPLPFALTYRRRFSCPLPRPLIR